jgi:hypothetical protein
MLTDRLAHATRLQPALDPTPPRGRALAAATCLAVALCLAAIAAALAPAAQAAPGWSAAEEVSGIGTNGYEAAVAVDPQGDAVATWMDSQGSGSGYAIAVATRPAGSTTWTEPVDLTAPGISGSSPTVAVDADGDAVVAWQQWNGTATEIEVSTHAAGAAGWSAAEILSDPLREATDAAVAISGGQAIVVWDGQNAAGNEIVQASVEQGFGDLWGSPIPLSAPGADADPPQIAMDAGGEAFVVWSRGEGTSRAVQEAQRAPDGIWSSPVVLSAVPAAGEYSRVPRIAVDAAGDAVVGWELFTGSDFDAVATTREAGGTWTTPRELTGAGEGAYDVEVGIDSAGDVIVAWEHEQLSKYVMQVRTAKAGGSAWSAAVGVSPASDEPLEDALAVGPAGDAVASWQIDEGSGLVVQAANHPVGGVWSAPVTLSQEGIAAFQPAVASDAAGEETVLWRYADYPVLDIRSSTYEPATPEAPGGEGGGGTGPGTDGGPGTAPGTGGGDGAPAPAAGAPSSPAPAGSPPAPPAARCPQGKVPRAVKVRVRVGRAGAKGKPHFKTKTVRRCVKPAPHKKPRAKRHHTKGH